MYISFDLLSDNARLWVYQSSKLINEDEQKEIINEAQSFINQWTAHGNNLQASFEIKYSRFLLIAVDEDIANATGCSIDSSVGFIRSIGQKYGLELFDRTQIAFTIDENIEVKSMSDFKSEIKSGKMSEQIKVFNNAITKKEELKSKWLLPLSESWAGRFLREKAI